MKRGLPFSIWVIAAFIAANAYGQPMVIGSVPDGARDFTSIGSLVYFNTNSGLYRTDGTESGTIFLANVTNARNFLELNGHVYFLATHPTLDLSLFRSDGTPAGTELLVAMDGIEILGKNSEYVFFSARFGVMGRELYRTYEGQGGILVKDINPGPGDGVASPAANSAVVLNDELFFSADDGVHGIELWKTDGSESGTTMVADVNSGSGNGVSPGGPFAVFDGKVFFRGVDDTYGGELWATDGTTVGTDLFQDLVPGSDGVNHLEFLSEHDGQLYFFQYDGLISWDPVHLWVTDGTPGAANEVEEVCDACRYDHRLVTYMNKLYFFMKLAEQTNNLWGTDGTAAGTESIFTQFTDGEVPFFDVVNDYMIFYLTSQGHNLTLYRSDGSAPTPFWTFNSAGDITRYISLAKVDDLLFFADHAGPGDMYGNAIDPEDSYQLLQTDGDSVVALRDIFDMSFKNTANVTNYEEKVMFTTRSDEGDLTLWFYDPSEYVHSFTVVNADTDEDIGILRDGDVFVKPEGLNINVRYNTINTPGSVVFRHQGKVVRRENEAPFSIRGDYSGNYLVWEGAVPGQHTIQATPYSGPNGTGEAGDPLIVSFTIQEGNMCIAAGAISYEKWNGVSGTEVSRIPVDSEPSFTTNLVSFEAPMNLGTNYGARIRGYICVPQTGNYTFWIASNDHGELWLSTDEDPANKERIAWLNRASYIREWELYSTQRSMPIHLEAGRQYYIEALHKQGAGSDHVAVGWQLPNGMLERPIAGNRLSPFVDADMAVARLASTATTPEWLEGINVYPNPATGNDERLTVAGFKGMERMIGTDVEILNMTGEVVFRDRIACEGNCDSYSLETGRLVPGMYFIIFKTEDSRFSKRLLFR